MLKASSLRKSLLRMSQQNMINEVTDAAAHTVCVNSCSFKQSELVPMKPSSSHGMKSLQRWASSFKKLDPRWQIRNFFNDMSAFGTVLSDVTQSDHLSEGAAIFSVWRPTSADAIARMMMGDGVGKGLEI